MGAFGTGFPPVNAFLDMLYGTGGVDWQTLTFGCFGGASGTVWPGNPGFTVTDFAAMYPKFFGPPSSFTGLTTTAGSATVTGFANTTGLKPGQLVIDPNFVPDTLILSVTSDTVIMTSNAISGSTSESIVVYTTPFVPLVVVLAFLSLASASVMYARYCDAWAICMGFFIAHYLTLYMRTESGPNSTASQVASSGLTKGVLISRHAGDVGASSQLVQGYEEFGAWMETEYGVQFITLARAINCGPIFVS